MKKAHKLKTNNMDIISLLFLLYLSYSPILKGLFLSATGAYNHIIMHANEMISKLIRLAQEDGINDKRDTKIM